MGGGLEAIAPSPRPGQSRSRPLIRLCVWTHKGDGLAHRRADAIGMFAGGPREFDVALNRDSWLSKSLAALARTPRRAGRVLIRVYQLTFSAMVGMHCRHLPTCSHYADEALDRFGLWAGGWMTLARLLRCQPWGTSGFDPVPATPPEGARWYLPWRYGRWRGVATPPPPSPPQN